MPESLVLVLTKDGRSYIRIPNTCGLKTTYLVNGSEADVAPGHSEWRIVVGDVTSITSVTERGKKHVGWRLRDSCKGTALSLNKPPEEFSRWDEYPAGDQRHFYEEVLEDQGPEHKDVAFAVEARDEEPVRLPEYVKVDFPANLGHKPYLQHQYPCRIPYEKVFGLLADSLIAKIGESPNYRVTDHRNIQCLRIDRRIEIPPAARVAEWQSYYPTLRSRKEKWRKVTHTERWVSVINVIGTYSNPGKDDVRTEEMRGSDYKDLKVNLQAYIDRFLDFLDPDILQVCTRCKGSGVVLESSNA